jgi:carbon storage regulator
MLVLSRKVGEQIIIGEDIRVAVVSISGDRVRLGFIAPADIRVLRTELCGPPDQSGGPGSQSSGSPDS